MCLADYVNLLGLEVRLFPGLTHNVVIILVCIFILGSDNFELPPADLTTSQTLALLTDKGNLSVVWVGSLSLGDFCPFSYRMFFQLFFFLR